MSKTPVTKFVCKNSYNLFCLALLNQGVVNDNVLLPRHAKEIRVTMSTSLATVNNMELMKREFESTSKCFHASLQITRLERSELIEQREDRDRVNGNHEDLQTSSEHPEIVEEFVSGLLNDRQETGKDRWCKNERQHL